MNLVQLNLAHSKNTRADIIPRITIGVNGSIAFNGVAAKLLNLQGEVSYVSFFFDSDNPKSKDVYVCKTSDSDPIAGRFRKESKSHNTPNKRYVFMNRSFARELAKRLNMELPMAFQIGVKPIAGENGQEKILIYPVFTVKNLKK